MPITHEEFKDNCTIIKKSITPVYDKLTEEDKINFNIIKVYGDHKNPLFNGSSVIKCIVKTPMNHDRIYNELNEDEVLEKQTIKGERHCVNLITGKGVIHLCYLYRSDIAILFQLFMREIITQLVLTETASLEKANAQLLKEICEEQAKIQEEKIIQSQLNKVKQFYNKNKYSNANLDTSHEMLYLCKLEFNEYYLYVVGWDYVNKAYWKKNKSSTLKTIKKEKVNTSKKLITESKYKSDSDSDIEADIKAVSMSDKKPKSRRSVSTKANHDTYDDDTNEPHPDAIQDSYEYDSINKSDLINDENSEYYFCISSKKINITTNKEYQFIDILYIKRGKHYETAIHDIINGEPDFESLPELEQPTNLLKSPPRVVYINDKIINNFGDNVITPIKNTYKTTYSAILSAIDRSFIRLNKHYILTN